LPEIWPLSTSSFFKKVSHLQLTSYLTKDCLSHVAQVFAHCPIRVLTLNQSLQDIPELLPECFNLWPQLIELHLKLDIDPSRIPYLNTAFTGIRKITCENFEEVNQPAPMLVYRVEDKQVSTPIWSLKGNF